MRDVDVLVCTVDRPDHVARVIADVLPQLRREDRLLILDQSWVTAPTRARIAATGDARILGLVGPRRGLPAARNQILAVSNRPIVLFLDDDVWVEDGLIEAHRQAFADPAVGGTAGRVTEDGAPWNSTRAGVHVDALGRVHARLDALDDRDVEGGRGCHMGFSRAALDQIRSDGMYFDPGYTGTAYLEETDVFTRVRAAGWRVRFLAGARLHHLAAPSGGVRRAPEVAEMYRFRNTARYLYKHHGMAAALAAAPAWQAQAVRFAWRRGDPGLALRLTGAWFRGIREVSGG